MYRQACDGYQAALSLYGDPALAMQHLLQSMYVTLQVCCSSPKSVTTPYFHLIVHESVFKGGLNSMLCNVRCTEEMLAVCGLLMFCSTPLGFESCCAAAGTLGVL